MKTLFAAVAAALCLAGCTNNHHGVSKNELPAPVLATLEQNSKGGTVNSIVKIVETTHTDYEADVSQNGRKWDIAIGEDGKLIYKKQRK